MELKERILDKVREYIAADESYDDDAQITINPESLEVGLVDGEEADGLPDSIDCYPAMDFVEMTADGSWIPDKEAIASAAAEYAG